RVIRLSPGARESSPLVPPTPHRGLPALRRSGPDDSGLSRDSRDSKLCSRPSGKLRLFPEFARIVQRRLANIQTTPALAALRCLQTIPLLKQLGNAFSLAEYFPDQPR